MDEADYWANLEYRLCREFAGMSENYLRCLWCDGFIPEQYILHGALPRITGRAWICKGSEQDEWKFTLLLPHQVSSKEEIDWPSLLPPENVTRWLTVDSESKKIEIQPVAMPDRFQPSVASDHNDSS